ncbi:F0F1 ATP synthase subunit epsilon [Humidisolicoccus flavus]|uniref:F0F1 ATP synthase subunit epsilon n=1 Tax=Humidisolicoccus flavus TaxID=3111414 RepID=UPI00325147DB
MPLSVSIVSADQEIWSGEAKQVVARTTEGEIGILSGHEPLLAVLGNGEVRVTSEDGTVLHINADEGFLSVNRDNVEVVARDAALQS